MDKEIRHKIEYIILSNIENNLFDFNSFKFINIIQEIEKTFEIIINDDESEMMFSIDSKRKIKYKTLIIK
jgi:acyl carrier protein